MIVAMSITSESSDHYLELFVDKTVEQIKEELYDNMEMYEPVSDYAVTFDDNTTPSEKTQVETMLSDWYNHSWGNDE
ncbi:hypothetical protein [Yersinia phage fHe-Yen9-04]|uniref:Uncharacterized protein n=2 Tax=Eneladusvirus Yen904 TaxID=2560849 RepID=A0A2C9CX34_9CAUD|nr:hypothetical protein FDJ41_gp074 [Yersinia phage fHe-Yen9-04]SOK58351.1 hypothetical protein [Yersinia phage fHe-Yen9-04]SOK58888.1 hypothetical protein [Yersinia phage fHe-Yen9-03]VUE36120.1 hypothetical protein [Yersinia phage fHe-Yen9-04]